MVYSIDYFNMFSVLDNTFANMIFVMYIYTLKSQQISDRNNKCLV